jgi:hypothetical protein
MSYSVRWTGGPEEHLLLMDNWMRVSQLAGIEFIIVYVLVRQFLLLFFFCLCTGLLNGFTIFGTLNVISKVHCRYIVCHQQSGQDREAGLLSFESGV